MSYSMLWATLEVVRTEEEGFGAAQSATCAARSSFSRDYR
jgi:hypothetical protein